MRKTLILFTLLNLSFYCKAQSNEFLNEIYEDSLVLQVIQGDCSKLDYWVNKGVAIDRINYDCEIYKHRTKGIKLLDILIYKNDTNCIQSLLPYTKPSSNSFYLIGKLGNVNTFSFLAKKLNPDSAGINGIYWGILDRQKYNCINRCLVNFEQSTINDIFNNQVAYLMDTDSSFNVELEKDTSDIGVRKVCEKYGIKIPTKNSIIPNCLTIPDTLNTKLLKIVFDRSKIIPDDNVFTYAATGESVNFPFVDYFIIEKEILPKSFITRIELGHYYIIQKYRDINDVLLKLINDTTGILSSSIDFDSKILSPLIDNDRFDVVNNLFKKLQLPFELLNNSYINIRNLLQKIDFTNIQTKDLEVLNFIQLVIEKSNKAKNENYLISDLAKQISLSTDVAMKNRLSYLVLTLLKGGYNLNSYEVREILLSAKDEDISYIVLPIIRYANDSDIISITKYLTPQEKNKIIQYFFLKGECSIASNASVLKDAVDDNNEQLVLLLSRQKKEDISTWSNYDIIKLLNIISSSSASAVEKQDFWGYYLKSISPKEELNKLLILSVQSGNYELINTILNNGADVNFENSACLRYALLKKDKDIIELICSKNPTIANVNEYRQFIEDEDVNVYLARIMLTARLLNCDIKYTPESLKTEYQNQFDKYKNAVGFSGHISSKHLWLKDGTFDGHKDEVDFIVNQCNYDFEKKKIIGTGNISLFGPFFCNKIDYEGNKTDLSLEFMNGSTGLPGAERYMEYNVRGSCIIPKVQLESLEKMLISPFAKIEIFHSAFDMYFPKNDNNSVTITITQNGLVIPYSVNGIVLDRTVGDINIQFNSLIGSMPEMRIYITNDYYDYKEMSQFDIKDDLKEGYYEKDRFAFYLKLFSLHQLYSNDLSNQYFKAYNSFLNLQSQKALSKKYDQLALHDLYKAADIFLRLDNSSLKLISFYANFNLATNKRVKLVKQMVNEAIRLNTDSKMLPILQRIKNELEKADDNLELSKISIDAFNNDYFNLLQRTFIEYQVYLLELAQFKTIDEIRNMTNYNETQKEKLKIVFDNTSIPKNVDGDFINILKAILK